MKLVASFTKTDPALLSKMALNKQPLDIDPKQIERVAALMKENGLLKTDLDIAAHVFK